MKKQLILVCMTLLIGILLSGPVKIVSWDIPADVKRLNNMHLSIDYVNHQTNTIIVYINHERQMDDLRHLGFDPIPMPNEAKEYARSLIESPKDPDNPTRAYLSFTEYVTFMNQTAAQYPDICQVVQIGLSGQNRPILYLKISDNVGVAEFEPEFRYISSIHGDEVVGFDMLIRLIQQLTSEYGTNPRITNLVNNTEIWINPLANPDGYVLQQRANAAGIDINRNFPMPTGVLHPDGNNWTPETIAMMDFNLSKRFVLSANFHGGALVMNYPWDYTYALAPDDALLQQASLTYSMHNLPMYNSTQFTNGITNGAAWYVITGSYQDWIYGLTTGTDITAEISNNKWPPASQLDTFWAQNQESMLSYMEFMHRGVKGIVSSNNGQPLDALISVLGNTKDTKTDPLVGDYHRMLMPGTYTIRASANGYLPQSEIVTVTAGVVSTQHFVLQTAQSMSLNATIRNMNGNAISGANIQILNNGESLYTGLSSADGSFVIPSILEGDYTIRIAAIGYAIMSQTYSMRSNNPNAIFILGQPIFIDEFESGTGQWTLQTPWATVNQSGNNVLTDSPAGNYANNQNRAATVSTAVSLQNIINPVLSFDTKYDLESGYDFVHVEVSTNGSTWTTLESISGVQNTWIPMHISLAAYQNQSVQIRFRLRTDTSVVADGIYLDNVQISGQNSNSVIFADIDSNWIVEMNDAEHILNYSAGINSISHIDASPWSNSRIEAADLDDDNIISSYDAYLACQYLLGSLPPVMGGTHSPVYVQPGFLVSNNRLTISFADADLLKALNLNLDAQYTEALENVSCNPNMNNLMLAINASEKKLAYVKHTQNSLASISFDFDPRDEVLSISMLVNGIEQSYNIPTSTSDNDNVIIPYNFELMQNNPNPFNPNTTISFSIPQSSKVTLQVFNSKGQKVKTLVNALLPAGKQKVVFTGKDDNDQALASGIYFYRLETGSNTQTKKMILMK